MAGEAELGAVGVLHTRIEGTPNEYAAEHANDDHAQQGTLRRIHQALEKPAPAFGFLSFVCHCSNPNFRWPYEAQRLISSQWKRLGTRGPSMPIVAAPISSQRGLVNSATIAYGVIIAGATCADEKKK
jgi:hypothetical protein